MLASQLKECWEHSWLSGCGPSPATSDKIMSQPALTVATYPAGLASEWGPLVSYIRRAFFQTAANKHCNKPMKMIEMLFNFKMLLGIINNRANRDLVEETIIFCSDFSWVLDKVVPMTIAAGNAAWTEHILQQSVNIFVPHIMDNKANRDIILSVFLFTWWERVSVCHTMEWV